MAAGEPPAGPRYLATAFSPSTRMPAALSEQLSVFMIAKTFDPKNDLKPFVIMNYAIPR